MDLKKSEEFETAAFEGNLTLVKQLVKDPAVNLNWRNDIGKTPFYFACFRGHIEVVRFLLGLDGLDPNLPQKQGSTPFYIACENGHVDVVSLLLGDRRIDVTKADNDGSTPLWIASQNGHLTVVKVLLGSGREVDSWRKSSWNKKRAAEWARARGSDKSKKDKWETEEDFDRRRANCHQIATLIEAYENDPNGTISLIRAELESHHRWTNRMRQPRTMDSCQQQQERLKLIERVQQADSRKSTPASQDSIWKCGICQEDLENPKTLPCVHSFCLGCLQKQTEKGRAPFRCALCTAQFTIADNGLESMKTSPILTASFPSPSTPSSSSSFSTSLDPNYVKCQLCEGSEDASSYCGECDQFLGPLCLNFHGRSPASIHHQLQSLDDHFSKSSNQKASKRVSRCQRHPNQEMDTFCKTCKLIGCPKCILKSHAKHDFCPLSEECQNLKGELIDITSTIAVREKEAADGVKKFVGALGKLEDERKGAADELEKTFDLLHRELDHRKAEMLLSLEDGVHRLDKVIRLEKEEVEFAMAELKGYREMNEALLTSGSDVEIAAGHSMLMTRGKTLEKDLGFLSESSVKSSISFLPKNLDAVKQAIASFGDIQ